MRRRSLLRASVLTPVLLMTPRAQGEARWMLVTPEEVRRSNEAPQPSNEAPRPSVTRGFPPAGAPAIVIEQPDPARPLRAPLTFRVRFEPAKGTTIDPNSFKASYGALGLDITSRLLQHAKLANSVLAMDNVDIPPGDHTVTLSIADNTGRKGSRTFRFTVG